MGYHRPADAEVERIILKAQELYEDRLRANRPNLRRENMASMIVGTASLALAIVVAVATILGLLGVPCGQWSEPRQIMVEASPPRFVSHLDLGSLDWVSEPVLVPSRKIWVPSHDCAGLALLGAILGGMGIVLSLQRRKFSWLSAIGFTLIVLMMATVLACDALMTLRP